MPRQGEAVCAGTQTNGTRKCTYVHIGCCFQVAHAMLYLTTAVSVCNC